MNNAPSITEQDIQRALRRFNQLGRMIRRLPEQVAPQSRLVGARYGAFENPASNGTTSKII